MRRLRGLLVVVLLVAPALAKDIPSYPEGDSLQVFGKNKFDLRIPKDFDASKKYALVLVLPGPVSDLDAFKDEPYIVCRPYPGVDRAGTMWSGGEVKVVLNLVAHLRKVLPIDPDRIHAVSIGGGTHSIFDMVVFHKKTPFVSATYMASGYKPSAIPAVAKKRMGVLAFEFKPEGGRPGVDKIVERLTGKVRTVELRNEDNGLRGAYFRYWLGVMEGRFKPGYDLSLAWREDAGSVEHIEAEMSLRASGAMIYFWSKQDVGSAEAKALQNSVFFDPDVRARAKSLVAIKLEKEEHEGLFSHYGLKSTPAVLVISAKGDVVKVIEGAVKAKTLARLMKRSGARR